MKKNYSKFRIALTTFAFGLASVFVFNGSLKYSDEVPVNLPKVKTDNVIVVSPKRSIEIPKIGGVVACGKKFLNDKEIKELK
jgi:hypothetical protein